jgi:hypothetical protein
MFAVIVLRVQLVLIFNVDPVVVTEPTPIAGHVIVLVLYLTSPDIIQLVPVTKEILHATYPVVCVVALQVPPLIFIVLVVPVIILADVVLRSFTVISLVTNVSVAALFHNIPVQVTAAVKVREVVVVALIFSQFILAVGVFRVQTSLILRVEPVVVTPNAPVYVIVPVLYPTFPTIDVVVFKVKLADIYPVVHVVVSQVPPADNSIAAVPTPDIITAEVVLKSLQVMVLPVGILRVPELLDNLPVQVMLEARARVTDPVAFIFSQLIFAVGVFIEQEVLVARLRVDPVVIIVPDT